MGEAMTGATSMPTAAAVMVMGSIAGSFLLVQDGTRRLQGSRVRKQGIGGKMWSKARQQSKGTGQDFASKEPEVRKVKWEVGADRTVRNSHKRINHRTDLVSYIDRCMSDVGNKLKIPLFCTSASGHGLQGFGSAGRRW